VEDSNNLVGAGYIISSDNSFNCTFRNSCYTYIRCLTPTPTATTATTATTSEYGCAAAITASDAPTASESSWLGVEIISRAGISSPIQRFPPAPGNQQPTPHSPDPTSRRCSLRGHLHVYKSVYDSVYDFMHNLAANQFFIQHQIKPSIYILQQKWIQYFNVGHLWQQIVYRIVLIIMHLIVHVDDLLHCNCQQTNSPTIQVQQLLVAPDRGCLRLHWQRQSKGRTREKDTRKIMCL
jgi:hypothetical protein